MESLIRLMAPGLNLVLAVGERLSKIVEPEDTEYYPPRATDPESPPPEVTIRTMITTKVITRAMIAAYRAFGLGVSICAAGSGGAGS